MSGVFMLEKKRANLQFAWAVFRLPTLLLLIFVFRHQLIEVLLAVLGEGRSTLFAIDVLSTPVARLVFACAMLLTLLLCAILTRNLRLSSAYAIVCILGVTVMTAAIYLTGRSIIAILPAALLLITNLIPSNLERLPGRDLAGGSNFFRWLMVGAVGVSEIFLFWRHIRWIEGTNVVRFGPALPRWLWVLPGALLASLVTAGLLFGSKLVPIEQAMRWTPAVRKVADGDFNWIQSDKLHKFMYTSGHGFERVRMFDLSDWSKPPVESDVSVGSPQGFDYSASADELYVYDEKAHQLRYFDANTLKLKKSFDVGPVSPGDCWIAADDRTNTITIVSEADEEVGYPFVVVDRATGALVDHQPEAAGNMTLDPDRSLAFLSFFRRESRVLVYDLRSRKIIKNAAIGPHAERMALWKSQHELLVTLPPQSDIARVNPDTLEVMGYIPALFGVRAIALDTAENLLFIGSIATGEIKILELPSMKVRARYYLGPWLRTIDVIPDLGTAYVSSNGAIYEVKYR
jgi:DNA-binding beta-propeller fold protein YncE